MYTVNDLTNISSELIFKNIIIIVIIILLLKSNLQINVLFYLFIGGLILFMFLKQEKIKKEKNYYEKLQKLNKIMNKKNKQIFSQINNSVLYKNPLLVKVFIRMYPFSRFNIKNFKEALISTNQLIRVYESAKLGQKLPNQTIDIVEELQRNILNNMQSIIHSFPSTVIADYRFQVDLNILQKILQKIIDDIHLIYQEDYEKNGPNIYNPPPSIRSGPWSNPLYTKEYNNNWNFYY
jgi:hypothetical protein